MRLIQIALAALITLAAAPATAEEFREERIAEAAVLIEEGKLRQTLKTQQSALFRGVISHNFTGETQEGSLLIQVPSGHHLADCSTRMTVTAVAHEFDGRTSRKIVGEVTPDELGESLRRAICSRLAIAVYDHGFEFVRTTLEAEALRRYPSGYYPAPGCAFTSCAMTEVIAEFNKGKFNPFPS